MRRRNAAWCLLLLEHLDELTTLAWYLAADGRLVEWAMRRTIERLDALPFDPTTPLAAYDKARETLICETLAMLKQERMQGNGGQRVGAELPELARLALLLERTLRSSEDEVAQFLDMKPAGVRELVELAMARLGLRMPGRLVMEGFDA